ncbi:MAG: hypothetical protein KF767_15400 [Bdellovibrionaceae bacterium]|nr:hypothetical protein [Pseudobdellovibrionaceae bacterium]
MKTKHLILGIATSITLSAGVSFAAGKEKSCISGGSVPAKLRVGQTGFQDEDITVVEGVSGPEVRIGKTTMFLSPGSAEEEKSSGGEPSRNNSWCFIDPELNRRNQGKPTDVSCDPFGSKKQDGSFEKPLSINGSNGRPIAEIHAKEVKDSNGKKMIQLIFKKLGSSDSRDKATNKLVITGHAKKEGPNVKSSIRLESRDFDGDHLNGVLESTILGRLKEGDTGNDPRGSDQFSSCKSPNQAKGQYKKTDNEAPESWVDLQGNHLVMRGNERYIQDQYRKDRAPLHAEDNTGRGGGVS